MLDFVYVFLALLALGFASWVMANAMAPSLTPRERIVLAGCAIAVGVVAGNLMRHAT